MKIAIYGKIFNFDFLKYIREFFEILDAAGAEITIYKPFLHFVDDFKVVKHNHFNVFEHAGELAPDINFIVSIGGDGTFLETIPFALTYNVPVIGLNSGRLGFLANISKEEISPAFQAIFSNDYQIEYRALLRLLSPENFFGSYNFALNEITVQKKGSSMITIDTFLDDEFLNTYWTDGLIISTPTGSTGYSISVGGPIVIPGSDNLILAPIASHNLSVRPVIIPDNLTIKIKVSSRQKQIYVTADNRTAEVDQPLELEIGKADRKLQMLKLPNNNFYTTLRNKLMWGADKRN